MTTPESPPRRPDSKMAHRRETWLQIYLWMGVGVAIIAVCLGLAMILPQPIQVETVSNFMVTVLVLCPMAICVFPLYIVMVLLVMGMGKLHGKTAHWMGTAERLSQTMSERVAENGLHISERVINLSARFAVIEQLLFGAFDRPTADEQKEAMREQSDPQ